MLTVMDVPFFADASIDGARVHILVFLNVVFFYGDSVSSVDIPPHLSALGVVLEFLVVHFPICVDDHVIIITLKKYSRRMCL